MLSYGISVVGTGRRQENLDEFVKQGGASASSSNFDITNLAEIPAWAASIDQSHPDLDMIYINSGIQRTFDFSKPDAVDLNAVNGELTTNYLAYIHIAMAFLPYLQNKPKSAFAFTTSGLGLVPIMRCGNYCASKAALHHWIMVFREQIKTGAGNVKCIEIIPPAVQTELHDEKHQPQIQDGRSIGMPLINFLDEVWDGLLRGKDQIPVGVPTQHVKSGGFEATRQNVFRQMNGIA